MGAMLPWDELPLWVRGSTIVAIALALVALGSELQAIGWIR
jgi:hypothetical protein